MELLVYRKGKGFWGPYRQSRYSRKRVCESQRYDDVVSKGREIAAGAR